MTTARSILGLLVLLALGPQSLAEPSQEAASTGESSEQVLVVVNGRPITSGDLELMLLSRSLPADLSADVRRNLLEQLVDKRLMQAFLKSRKVQPNAEALNKQVQRIYQLIRKSGDDPAKILARLGYDEQSLREELALPLMWNQYLGTILTQRELREYWAAHRHEFDGTEVRVSQILIKVSGLSNAAEVGAAEAKLLRLRSEIQDGKTTFAEAAQMHSDAPSREQGGDVGFFPYRGEMPVSFSRVAFALKVGEISEPFTTPFGIHLCTVTERKPGQLSLEDARPQVLRRLSNQRWHEAVQSERSKARIEWRMNESP